MSTGAGVIATLSETHFVRGLSSIFVHFFFSLFSFHEIGSHEKFDRLLSGADRVQSEWVLSFSNSTSDHFKTVLKALANPFLRLSGTQSKPSHVYSVHYI